MMKSLVKGVIIDFFMVNPEIWKFEKTPK